MLDHAYQPYERSDELRRHLEMDHDVDVSSIRYGHGNYAEIMVDDVWQHIRSVHINSHYELGRQRREFMQAIGLVEGAQHGAE